MIIRYPCVVLPFRTAARLYSRFDLDRLAIVHRSELDEDERKALMDMKSAAEWVLQRGSGTAGTGSSSTVVPSAKRRWQRRLCTEECLTTDVVAERLGITARAVRKRITSGFYKQAHRASGSWHVLAEEIRP